MTDDKIDIVTLRKARGWSQEKLAAICGISERTIQRIEKDGTCSLESKLALASAFELSPNELVKRKEAATESGEYITDWSGAFGLFILGMAFPVTILLTGTNGIWEMMSFFAVVGLTITISIITHGAKAMHKLLDNTSWIVKYPTRTFGLNPQIAHANSFINNTYIIGCVIIPIPLNN